MRAAVYHGTAELYVENVPDPGPQSGEVVLEIHSTGICGTDAAEFVYGPFQYPIHERHPITGHLGPFIPGHEVAGHIVAVGPEVAGFAEGDLVASGAGISCSECAYCREGRTNLCDRYTTVGLQRNGGLAQFCALPASTCVKADPFGLHEDTTALAQPMAIAVHSMRQGRPRPGDRVLVIGAGGIGAFLTFALSELGAEVLVADLNSDRLTTAADLGAAHTVQPSPAEAPAELVRGLGFAPRVVYEVSGSESGMEAALDLVERGGRVVAIGLHGQPRAVDLRAVTLREVDIAGTMAHVCADDLPEAMRLLAARRGSWSDVAPVATTLERLVDDGILPMAESRAKQIKTLIDPWATDPRPTTH